MPLRLPAQVVSRDFSNLSRAKQAAEMETPMHDFFARLDLDHGAAAAAAAAAAPWPPGSPSSAKERCDEFASSAFPDAARDGAIRPAAYQGFCSYTLYVGPDLVLQFRLPAHRIDPTVAALASTVYGSLAPRTTWLGTAAVPGAAGTELELPAYSISRIPGAPLADFRLARPQEQTRCRRQDQRLVRDFARLVAQGWRCALEPAAAEPLRGRVGSSLRWRLELLRDGLPARFRPVVLDLLAHLADIEALPWAFTHGDLVPGNVMVDAAAGQARISGLIDWAEAEYLPLGVGLYGLEEFLGESKEADVSSGGQYPPPGSTFVYFPAAARLREAFWNQLRAELPELRDDQSNSLRATIERAHQLGILLWHGIAFDGGRLDRVVAEGVDDAEIQRLDLFLLGDAPAPDPDDEPIEDPNEAILDDVIDEDDSMEPHPDPGPPPSGAIVRPETVPPPPDRDPAPERRPSFGRRAWEYVRRLGKL